VAANIQRVLEHGGELTLLLLLVLLPVTACPNAYLRPR
jgi:hypothetical protein